MAQAGDGPGGTASAVESWRKVGLNVDVIDLTKIGDRKPRPKRKPRGAAISMRPASKPKRHSLPTRIMAMLFADAVNFSKLTEPQIPRFLSHFLGANWKPDGGFQPRPFN
jgi:hypothetical protein